MLRRPPDAGEADAIPADDIWNDYPPGEPGATWMRLELENEDDLPTGRQ